IIGALAVIAVISIIRFWRMLLIAGAITLLIYFTITSFLSSYDCMRRSDCTNPLALPIAITTQPTPPPQ
ncbi:MAG: hypothetical protein QXS54_08445, partial [Candidatus Methanomethylicaceae archaeon]